MPDVNEVLSYLNTQPDTDPTPEPDETPQESIPEDERSVPTDADFADEQTAPAVPQEEGGPAADEDADDADEDAEDIPSGDADDTPPEGQAADVPDPGGDIEDDADADEADEGDDAGLDAMLLARATTVGLDPAGFGDNADALTQAVTQMERRFAEIGQPRETEAPVAAVVPEAVKPEPTPVPKADASTEAKPLLDAETISALEDEMSPRAVGVFKALAEEARAARQDAQEARAAAKAVQQGIQATEQDTEAKVTRDFANFLDDSVEALGEDWRDVLGTGRVVEGTLAPAFHKARGQIVNTMRSLANGIESTGGTVPDLPQLFQSALHVVHGKRLLDAAKQQGADEKADEIVHHNKHRGSGRPSGTRRRPKDDDQAAVEIAQKYADTRDARAADLAV